MKYSFFDDYSDGVHSEILDYIVKNNDDQQLGYCLDHYCEMAADRIKQVFNVPEADIHFLPNGTMANIVGLSALLRPFEGVISPVTGHLNHHETGALEATGHKILPVTASDGKLTPDLIAQELARYENEHTVLPRVVYVTQATEVGTAYSRSELTQVVEFAKKNQLRVYLDGARLAMALANESLGITMHDMGSLGLDMFYIGGTKNGGLYGEAMVIVNDEVKPYFRHYMKRQGGLMAKGRFLGQQFVRFFEDDNLWLQLGGNANKQAQRLREGLEKLGIEFDVTSATNQIFPILPNDLVKELAVDYGFHEWQKIDNDRTKIRLVCSWATTSTSVDEFVGSVATLLP